MKKSAATRPTPIVIAGSSSALRVSTASIWTDHVWQFDVTVPGTTQSEVKIDWSFTLSDGSHFTDGRWVAWRETSKRFLWTLRVDPPAGHRRARDSTMVRIFTRLRVLVRWMMAEGYCQFSDLDRDVAERFLAMTNARAGRKGRLISRSTLGGYAGLLNLLYLQRHHLSDAPSEDLLLADQLRLLTGRRPILQSTLPYTPDAIAVPLVCAAIRLLNHPADDIIALRDRANLAAGTARPGGRREEDARIQATAAYFIFSTPTGEERPWRTEPVADLATINFLVSRLYDACFVVIAYLVGARVSEILGLKVGCIVEHMSADGTETFTYLSGRIYKTSDNPHGQPHRWIAPEPVVRAVAVLERISEPLRRQTGRDDLWVMPAVNRNWGIGIRRSTNLIAHLNGSFAAFIDLPHYNGVPWHLTTHQGRKTFARFVGRRDRTGLHALATHLGHITRIMTDASYVSTDFKLGDLIDAEALEETRGALEELLTATRLAGKAGRTMAAHSRFRGRTRDGDVRKYVDFILHESDMRLGVCDWGYCVYRREGAACLGGDSGPNPVLRTQSTCGSCANFAVTEKHRPVWAARRQRNVDLLAHPALDTDSRALAAERVEECDLILTELDQSRDIDGA
jgi:integrase